MKFMPSCTGGCQAAGNILDLQSIFHIILNVYLFFDIKSYFFSLDYHAFNDCVVNNFGDHIDAIFPRNESTASLVRIHKYIYILKHSNKVGKFVTSIIIFCLF